MISISSTAVGSNGHFKKAFDPSDPAPHEDALIAGKLKSFSRLAGWLTVSVGIMVLAGWIFGLKPLMTIFPGLVAMNPLTAICFILAGTCLIISQSGQHAGPFKPRLGHGLAWILVIIGLSKVINYMSGWELPLDQTLFKGKLTLDATGFRNQMAPNTAFSFLLCGLALVLLNLPSQRRSSLAQSLTLVVIAHSLLVLLGYLYSAAYLYGIGPNIPMALHTACAFLLVSLGLLFIQTGHGAVALFVSDTHGGTIARRLLPFALAIPAALGLLRLWGERLHLHTSEMGTTLMVLACISAFTGLIWWNALLLNRIDLRRREVERQLQEAHDQLEIRVQERTADLLKANQALRTEIAERQKAQECVRTQTEEKRKLEEQLLRSQRMESLGALAGGIAHDLNNALVPVLMGSQLLEHDGETEMDRQKLLDLIKTGGQRCSQMVKQILTFTRGTKGQTISVSLRHLIGEMVKLAKDTFPKSITIHSLIPKELWSVQGDATEMHQVLMNLCVNARDAMPTGGGLSIAAENTASIPATELAHSSMAAEAVGPGPHVRITVADTGTGIPPHLLDRIFEPFFTTKGPDKGTGLGLSTVSSIVKRHKGFIKVRSNLGRGTEFRIYLPAVPGVAAMDETTPQAATLLQGNGELVLLADDERVVLELTKSALENYGYRVLTAANGLEAVAAFESRSREVQVLVTDVEMPFLDGLSAARGIRKMAPEIPIILATGSSNHGTEYLSRMDLAGIVRLSKPYNLEQLLAEIARALNSSKARTSGMSL